LLQLLDDGRLSDAAGDTADFTHAVVVMTSNLGARVREAVGFGEDGVAEARLDSDRAVRDFFPPELFNRIDRIVHFRPLDREVAEKVAQKELARLLARPGLSSRNVFVTVADEVRSFAVDQAFDKRMGARSIKRWLEEEVGGRLAEALVHGPAAPMRRAQVWIEGGRMLVESQALVAREPSRGLLALEPLLKAPAPELVLKLRQASEALFALSHGAAQDRLVERMRFHVARHATGDQAHAEPAYALDAVRQRVTELLGKADSLLGASKEAAQDVLEADLFGTLERSSPTFGDARIRLVDRRALPQAVRAASRTQLLEALAEILFLRRALANAADPTRHGATMVLTRFGSARTGTWADCQLIRQLATAYGTGRGVVESWQVRHADYPPLDGEAKDLERQLSNRLVEEVAIRLSGLCLYDYFEGESGLHVWQSLGRLPQLVQVRVLTADAKAPGIVLDERARAREAFKKARAQGRTEVADPDAPLPTVRVYRFEPAVGRDAATPLEVEDFELGWATATRGKSPVDALPELWRLRMSREDEAGG
jgi:ATP-dependent Clp protease ATP-binding subunit ClpA/ATP-dependent Clp protease ATP-binding subunit ClpC